MKNLFSTIIFVLLLTVTTNSQTRVFNEQTNGYVFSKEIRTKLGRFKSKEEIKKWRVEKLNNEISFTKIRWGNWLMY
jgi:hypothetical protein